MLVKGKTGTALLRGSFHGQEEGIPRGGCLWSARAPTTRSTTCSRRVAEHVARGLYSVLSMNMSEYSCVVVMSTGLPRQDLMWKDGFPVG
ncbi:hypothetical protein VSDG_00841 [Cytospora chrysosperma]|uniref:Uncharacterized protein n=1 Tax=Cytospora chrysosperma TaxID=252740 RepID=A0A423WKP2_CYTCH|nr:hypothetical protein VSDG_00841 [Valsa sordida]